MNETQASYNVDREADEAGTFPSWMNVKVYGIGGRGSLSASNTCYSVEDVHGFIERFRDDGHAMIVITRSGRPNFTYDIIDVIDLRDKE